MLSAMLASKAPPKSITMPPTGVTGLHFWDASLLVLIVLVALVVFFFVRAIRRRLRQRRTTQP